MKTTEFLKGIRTEVRDSAVQDALSLLQSPPGRRPDPNLVAMSQWYNRLSENDRLRVREVAMLVSDLVVFGFLTVLDGDRPLTDDDDKGTFELHHKKGDQVTLLNDPQGQSLHDLFRQEEKSKLGSN